MGAILEFKEKLKVLSTTVLITQYFKVYGGVLGWWWYQFHRKGGTKVESDRKKKRQNIFDYFIVLKCISKTFYIIFLKQILSAFICRTLYFSSMFSLGAMSDFVERGRFRAW